MNSSTLTTLLRLDAAANLAGGIALIAAGTWLANPLGLGTAWPLWLVGVVFLVNGMENELVARRTRARGLVGLAAVDLAFAIAVFAIAIADPSGAEVWTRWAMGGLATLTAAVGIAKAVALRSLADVHSGSEGGSTGYQRPRVDSV